MKLFFIFVSLFLVSCTTSEFKLTPKIKLASEQIKIETEKVENELQSKPNWLFVEDICPAELIPTFEKKIEYLSEGCENNPYECLQKCKNQDANACYSLALLIQKQKNSNTQETQIPILDENVEFLFLRSCRLGIISGCTNQSAGRFNPDNKDKLNDKCVADTFERTCARKDSWGCTMYGLSLIEGVGREKNINEALKVLPKACEESKEDEACHKAKELEQLVMVESKKKNGK